MYRNIYPVAGLLFLSPIYLVVTLCGDNKPAVGLYEQRQRLASLKVNMDSTQVLKILGKPDEIRRIPKDGLLDGTRLSGGCPPFPNLGPETERWTYGVLGKGMFAAVGYVSIDRKGKMVAAIPVDFLSLPGAKPIEQVPAASNRAVKTPTKLSCHLKLVEIDPAKGNTTMLLKTIVTLKNEGTKRFELKHDAAPSIRSFLLIEIRDSKKKLLFRENRLMYHSPVDPTQWSVLSIAAGTEKSDELYIFPSLGFGRLPTVTYYIRVYFPFTENKYYPSNLVRIELRED